MKKIISLILVLVICLGSLTSCSFLLKQIGVPFTPPSNSNDGGQTQIPSSDDLLSKISLVGALLNDTSYYDYSVSEEDLLRGLVYAYQEKTGDLYAYYYTEDEFEELNREYAGETQGIGVSVIENIEYGCIEVISVYPNSPAMNAGIHPGDLIVQSGCGSEAQSIIGVDFNIALNLLRGLKGTVCSIGVVRNNDFNNIIEFTITRDDFISESVVHAVCEADHSIGIVKLLNFDYTTPVQFKAAMSELIAKGCNKFIYDCRFNPGGDKYSIFAILSYFLNKNDVLMITEDRNKNTEESICEAVSLSGNYSGCSVAENEIGMYRNYKSAVIVNQSTASAAELFTGTLKTYNISTIVGTTTFGKGCMQSIIPLSSFDASFSGALKLTTYYYRPYGMENYHDIGISPTEGYEIEQSPEALKINNLKLLNPELQAKDVQLAKAVSALQGN